MPNPISGVYVKARLETRDGGFVTNVYVPPFLLGLEAEVIFWGSRFFTRKPNPTGDVNQDHLTYTEAFAYAVPPGHDDLSDGDGRQLA